MVEAQTPPPAGAVIAVESAMAAKRSAPSQALKPRGIVGAAAWTIQGRGESEIGLQAIFKVVIDG